MNIDKFAVVDLETTVLDRRQDSIVELGLTCADGDVEGKVESNLVSPGSVTVYPEITAFNGITQDMVDQAWPIKDVLEEFVQKTDGFVLVGHNIFDFDAQFLRAAVWRHASHLEPDLSDDRFVDTVALYKGWKMGIKPRDGQSHAEYAAVVLATRVRELRHNLRECCRDLKVSTK